MLRKERQRRGLYMTLLADALEMDVGDMATWASAATKAAATIRRKPARQIVG